jgi:hypothetical protein
MILTGRIDFVDPHSVGELVLQLEETRIVNSPFSKHAIWHPEITKQVIDAGMTVASRVLI